MGVCCLHMCQQGGTSGENMSTTDVMEEDSTESFVDLECDDAVQDKEQLLEEHQGAPSQVLYEQNVDRSPDITGDDKEVTHRDEGLTCQQEKPSQEATEPGKNADEVQTLQGNIEDIQPSTGETLVSQEVVGQDIQAEYDPDTSGEGDPKTQTVDDGYGSPQDTTCEGSHNEDLQEHNEPLVSNKTEPHNTQGDKAESNAKEGNGQEPAYWESDDVNPEKTTEDSQEARDSKQEEHETPTLEVSQESKDVAEDDSAKEEMSTREGSWKQPEEQPLEPPRLKTEGAEQSLWTSRIDGAVMLRMEECGPAAVCPVTVSQFFSEAVKKHGQKVALCIRAADKWEGISYTQYEQLSRAVARGFLKLGLVRFHAVLILGYNAPEWFMAEIGAMLAGGLAVGIDPSSTASFCLKVALDSQAQIILVDDHSQMKKILQIQEKLPNLTAIIQWSGRVVEPRAGTYTWKQLVDLGSELEESYLEAAIANQEPHQCCAVMYSADDSGEPRGAMISHDNVTWTSSAMREMLGLGSEEVVVSYLPLGHMSVQLFDLWLPLSCGGTTYFTEADVQKGSLLSTLCDVHPTLFLGFPGLWEKVKKKWTLVEKKATLLQKMTIGWAKRKGLLSYTSSGSLPWGHGLADHLVFRPARLALGLDRCTRCYVGTEAVSQDVVEYFGSLGINLLELYGKNETSGVQSIMLPSSWRTERVELVGCKSHCVQDGLCLWGRHVFLGYLGREQMTSEAFTENGWFITGLKIKNEDAEDLYMEL